MDPDTKSTHSLANGEALVSVLAAFIVLLCHLYHLLELTILMNVTLVSGFTTMLFD